MAFSSIPRLWRAVLIVSLLLNLLTIGYLAGAAAHWKDPNRSNLRTAGPLAPFMRALPDADRRAITTSLREAVPQRDRADRQQARMSIIDAIRADPFEPAALESLLAEQRRKGGQRLSVAETAFARQLARMTPGARAEYATALERRLSKGR